MLEPEFSAKDIIKDKVVKMSIIDKFLDVMRLNDDDYEFDNEDYDYDEEEDYEVKEKNLPVENAKRRGTATDRSNF